MNETLSQELEPATEQTAEVDAITVKNPRIGKVLKLQQEAERQNKIEKQRSKRILQEQEYIDKMNLTIEENLRNTKVERLYNQQLEEQIRSDVYRLHGISEDKLQGMTEYKNAWYQGISFAMFFLSLILFCLCGWLHGFGSELSIFVAFYTAIEGALLTNGKRQWKFLDILLKLLYILLFPIMMVVFTCYELGFEQYLVLVNIFTVAGVLVLMLGAVSYFLYDPYREERQGRRKANRYLVQMEKAALKEIQLKEKAELKEMKSQEKAAAKEAKRQEKEAKRQEKEASKEEEASQ